jgi:hypothetical protein
VSDPFAWLWKVPIKKMTIAQLVLAISVLRSRRLCGRSTWCPISIWRDDDVDDLAEVTEQHEVMVA